MSKKLKILFLMDFTRPVPPDLDDVLKGEEWKDEMKVIRALRNLGHEVKTFAIFDRVEDLIEEVKRFAPDIVFNQCEGFRADRKHEPNIVALLELLNIPYTGPGPASLQICKDKGLTKQILTYHRMRVPKFLISDRGNPIQKLKNFVYPCFIKPLALEASEGISQVSFAETERQALDRVLFIHESMETDAIVEEYIEGREIYVGVLGNDRLKILPPRELFFSQVPAGEPKFATYQAKWNDDYRKKWGIRTGPAKSLSKSEDARLKKMCKKIYRLFEVKGFARIDLRIRPNGEIVFIEVNPNPSLHRDDDFALAAEALGLDYESLLEQIITLGLNSRKHEDPE